MWVRDIGVRGITTICFSPQCSSLSLVDFKYPGLGRNLPSSCPQLNPTDSAFSTFVDHHADGTQHVYGDLLNRDYSHHEAILFSLHLLVGVPIMCWVGTTGLTNPQRPQFVIRRNQPKCPTAALWINWVDSYSRTNWFTTRAASIINSVLYMGTIIWLGKYQMSRQIKWPHIRKMTPRS